MVSPDAYRAARHAAAAIVRHDRGLLAVAGADRRSYLHGLLTNDIVSLEAGAGCYAAYLTPQGRMITDLFVYELGDSILATTARATTRDVLAKLDQFVFTEDVQLGDVTDTFSHVSLVGPSAPRVLAALLAQPEALLRSLPEHGNRRLPFEGQSAIVTRAGDLGEPGFDVYVEKDAAEHVMTQLKAAGAADLDAATAEAIRVEAGVPWFGPDMDAETIPLEAGIESRAISFTKGCYVGQEVIIRVLHRGHGRVARKLVGLSLDGLQVPSPGTTIRAGDREVGHITSAVMSPALEKPIALAYVQRDFVAVGTELSVDGSRAIVHALPFVARRL